MDNIKFSSINELYDRLVPAMDTKVNELKMSGISYITIDDIWNYLSIYKWGKAKDLTLNKCVDDILNTSDLEYQKYAKEKMMNILGGN